MAYRSWLAECLRVPRLSAGAIGNHGYLALRLLDERPVNDQPVVTGVASATVRRRRRIPLVWFVPIVSAIIAAWLAWNTYTKRGPTITISFQSAEGLQAGQSHMKFKDVDMGAVSNITVAPDLSK